MDVPAISPYVFPGNVELINGPTKQPFSSPGALTSGFILPSSVGPLLLKHVCPFVSEYVAPTTIVFFAVPPGAAI